MYVCVSLIGGYRCDVECEAEKVSCHDDDDDGDAEYSGGWNEKIDELVENFCVLLSPLVAIYIYILLREYTI